MAHALSITDGTTTVSLSTDNFMLLQYVPNTPSMRNGVYDPAVENIELLAYGATPQEAQDAIHSVERLLTQAKQRQHTFNGAKVYLTLTLDSGEPYRSEVLTGDFVLGNDSLRAWGGAKIACTLILTREYYWEGEEKNMFSNRTFTATQAGGSIYSGANVDGALPTPAKIKLVNTSGSIQYPQVHFGINAFNDPVNFEATLDGATLTWTAPTTFTLTYQNSWYPSSADLAAMGGAYWRFVGIYSTDTTQDVYWRMQTRYNVDIMRHTDEVYFSNEYRRLKDFGSMQMPSIVGGLLPVGAGIEIAASSQDVSGSDSLAWVQMFPSNNYRFLRTIGGLAAGSFIMDDQIEEEAYISDGGSSAPHVFPQGNKTYIYPGQKHRFYWAMDENASETQDLTISYRPRRVTI